MPAILGFCLLNWPKNHFSIKTLKSAYAMNMMNVGEQMGFNSQAMAGSKNQYDVNAGYGQAQSGMTSKISFFR